jgi:glycosyltransferase involved in cell wall biosynthesis
MRVAIVTTDNREHYKTYGELAPSFGMAPEALLQGLEQQPELEVHVVSCTQQLTRSPAKLAENVFFHALHVPKIGWMRTFYQGCIRAIRSRLRQISPEIVHGQGTERECALGAIASGFPNVVTIHGNMRELARLFKAPIGSFSWLAGMLETFALRRTSGVFCNSAYTEQLVSPRARQTWRVPNAIRSDFFHSAAEPVTPRPCILLNVGFISPRKRQVELLKVADQLYEQGLGFEFQFVGHADLSDPYTARFLEEIKPMESKGFARFVGPKSTGELIRLFDASAALVHFPSEEAFGLVVAEALARDLKLFGARAGGIRDITAGVSDAELLDATDWSGLTAAIAEWIRRGFPRSSGAAHVMRERYHPGIIAQRHLEIYREVLHSCESGRPRNETQK